LFLSSKVCYSLSEQEPKFKYIIAIICETVGTMQFMFLRSCQGEKIKWTKGKVNTTAVSEIHARDNPSK
jgi:hypothetical protein